MNTIKSTISNSIEFLIVGNRHLQIKIINFILSRLESRKDKLIQKNIAPFFENSSRNCLELTPQQEDDIYRQKVLASYCEEMEDEMRGEY
jgi:hypothetical protein